MPGERSGRGLTERVDGTDNNSESSHHTAVTCPSCADPMHRAWLVGVATRVQGRGALPRRPISVYRCNEHGDFRVAADGAFVRVGSAPTE